MQSRFAGVRKRIQALFLQVPAQLKDGFQEECIQTNLNRFSILPYFNIVTQVACVFIYLYVYPTLFPQNPQLDPVFFLLFTAAYIIENIVVVTVLRRYRRGLEAADPAALRGAERAIDWTILGYVVLEAAQVGFEMEISGNIYRFLATFFVVSFFPVLSRGKKLSFMFLYIVIAQVALYYLQATKQIDVFSFPEVIIAVFVVCGVATCIYYSSILKSYILKMNLVETNKRLVELNEELERLSITDALTGISNRRALGDYAESLWKASLRGGDVVSMLMIDIDYFKAYNDTYGHQMGDECLRVVAATIKGFFNRATDMTARYGGEEFAVMLPYTQLESSVEMAEEVRRGVEALQISNGEYGYVTISIGVASLVPELSSSHETLIKMADDALYAAKDAGRNRVYIAGKDGFYPAEEVGQK